MKLEWRKRDGDENEIKAKWEKEGANKRSIQKHDEWAVTMTSRVIGVTRDEVSFRQERNRREMWRKREKEREIDARKKSKQRARLEMRTERRRQRRHKTYIQVKYITLALPLLTQPNQLNQRKSNVGLRPPSFFDASWSLPDLLAFAPCGVCLRSPLSIPFHG